MKKVLKFFAKSKYADLVGVALVISIAIYSGYLSTKLSNYVDWGPWTNLIPLGFISVINVGLSMMSTRLTGRLSNLGNILGIINTILSGTIDYILGNKGAILTYPITFFIYTFAIKHWQKSDKGKASQPLTGCKAYIAIGAIAIGTFIFSFVTNYIGYFGDMNILFWITTFVFGFSMTANILNAFKLTVQWQFWTIYNILQTVKALIQGNYANLGKYIFYIINSISAMVFWKDTEE